MAPLTLRGRPASDAIESALVRRSVDALGGGRCVCRHCRRTPLVGERVHLYGDDVVCELCLPLRRGAPDSSPLVHHPEHEHSVRPCARPGGRDRMLPPPWTPSPSM